MPVTDDSLVERVSAALERLKSLQVLILSWEDRLRACELRALYPNVVHTDGSPYSSTSSYVDGESTNIGQIVRGSNVSRPVICAIKSCTDNALPEKRFCRRHLTRACHYSGCTKTRLGAEFCIRHGGGKRCEVPGCTKGASGTIGGNAHYCIAHGGGRRCRMEGCKSTAKREGLCSSHGGRYECSYPNCSKTAHGPRHLCNTHNTLGL